METRTNSGPPLDADDSTFAATLWVLAATAWFVMSVLFVRHGFFSAALLLLIALICLPRMRTAFRRQTGIRMPRRAVGTIIVALAVASLACAGRNIEVRQSRQSAFPAGSGTDAESGLSPHRSEPVRINDPSTARAVAIAGVGP